MEDPELGACWLEALLVENIILQVNRSEEDLPSVAEGRTLNDCINSHKGGRDRELAELTGCSDNVFSRYSLSHFSKEKERNYVEKQALLWLIEKLPTKELYKRQYPLCRRLRFHEGELAIALRLRMTPLALELSLAADSTSSLEVIKAYEKPLGKDSSTITLAAWKSLLKKYQTRHEQAQAQAFPGFYKAISSDSRVTERCFIELALRCYG